MAERIVFGDENAFHAVTPNSHGSVFPRISITVLRRVVSGCQEFVLQASTHDNPPVRQSWLEQTGEIFVYRRVRFTEFATPRRQKFALENGIRHILGRKNGRKTGGNAKFQRCSRRCEIIKFFFDFQRDAASAVYNVNRKTDY